ncbi:MULTISPECIES: peptidoglycan DD-metalloendopeptidase family protein [Maribacter]|uniref:Peptidoglycan DD-metalloendopeptidase family protein n=1 Tax=Maribacter flavus TaxID=1658664 RepID=A0ABU7IF50_9FLAO|nr:MULTISPECIES: peptidoglycan DD-metalloendopeptidase family protein [Maribacter]MDC6404431.1 peptidoglycan DD-metalloendopeptidase family protein [Maribacter sp. PR66]MEE1971575.1 peptidoglycan DD-metalloendopeptidase family protein [Maribacter flavus]
MRKYWGILFTLALLGACQEEKVVVSHDELKISPVEDPIVTRFGFNFEEFNVHLDTIKYGDSFGELMLKNKVEYPKIATISEKFRDTFDVRKIRVGKPYLILKAKDTSEQAQVFIYQNNPIDYTVVDFRDSVQVYKGKKRVKYVEREVSGIIETNLSEAILAQGIDYSVTHNLANVFAWTIDFSRLQKYDRFKIIFKEKYINDTVYAGSEPLVAAYFEHNGIPLYAFSYEGDTLKNQLDYYDHEANNLRRAFLKMPVEFGRLSSRYNLKRRIRYYGYKVRPHKGTDYAAPIGTPILATADGTVTESTRRGGNGKYVKIRHNETYSTQYLHMKNQNVKKGQFVRQGDVIGWVGMTGNTGGPHVCYRFWKNERQVDPLQEELPLAEPLADSLRPDYFAHIEPIKEQLDCIVYPERIEEDDLLTLNELNGTK